MSDKRSYGLIKSDELNFSSKPLLVKEGRGKESKEEDVRINLKKEEGVVRIIEVVCTCGKKIQLICEYENEVSK